MNTLQFDAYLHEGSTAHNIISHHSSLYPLPWGYDHHYLGDVRFHIFLGFRPTILRTACFLHLTSARWLFILTLMGFGPSLSCRYYDLGWLLAVRCYYKSFDLPARPPQIRTCSFSLMPAAFTHMYSEWLSGFDFFSSLTLHVSLICGFCPSGQTFAAGFLQIPPRDGHHCLWLYASRH